jgi:hypothetical protein
METFGMSAEDAAWQAFHMGALLEMTNPNNYNEDLKSLYDLNMDLWNNASGSIPTSTSAADSAAKAHDLLQRGELITSNKQPDIANRTLDDLNIPGTDLDYSQDSNVWLIDILRYLMNELPDNIRDYVKDLEKFLNDPSFRGYYDLMRPLLPDGIERLIDNIFPSPIVFDMDGDGVELFSLAESKTLFDIDNDGFMEVTGWVKPDDALLVHDANNNGTIDNQAELFGDGGGFYDGFAKLDAQFDSNNDNLINASDTNFNKLRVWQDVNSNGISEAGELKTLAQVGITSISLADTYSSRVIAGHDVLKASTFVRHGQTREALDMVFDGGLFFYKNSLDMGAEMIKVS